MNIPFLDLAYQHDLIRSELDQAYYRVMNSSWFILGKEVEEFEIEAANYFGVDHAIGVASGLDALIISLRVAGIGSGDEVLVPAHTYIATWQAISMIGAHPVPIPMEFGNFNIDAKQLESFIGNKTKAILPVHLYGIPADMDSLMQLAQKYQLKVIEDNSQAQGAIYKGKKTGSFGHINGVSLYPGKNLGAMGDAGIILTNDQNYANKAKTFRNYGSSKKYHHEYLGYNSRLDEMQAAFLKVKLKYLDQWNEERRRIATFYRDNIANPNITIFDEPSDVKGVNHIFPILSPDRDSMAIHLLEKGIRTMIHYPTPIHLQPAYQHLNYKKGQFSTAEKYAAQLLSLPIYPGLSIKNQVMICKEINAFTNY